MSDPLDSPTGTAPRPAATPEGSGSRASRTPPTSATRVSADLSSARFAPGAVIADRYRIVGLLGRGGMGEVYRADDLRLEQPVALKFLPEAVEGDAERLARFYNEARLARQVTHPSVCRVHDLGEVDGHVFLSMEYVDGEDLGSLRKRIGRLSTDKALEIGRQVCTGLAAAHAKGVLHRDLKPGNVMVDGEGRARITDFGLAGVAEEIHGDDVRSGTPAYMSPEQLEGREVTVKSDVFSLGLLLYELVTGRRAFDGKTMAEVMRQRGEPPSRPSALVPDLDPRVEALILRCLERDPIRRPGSALAVAAGLPGGDPLASLLAEGHTPSPEMVAAAGEAEGRLPTWAAVTCLLVALAGTVLVPRLSAPVQLTTIVPFEKPPAVLEDRAREIVARLGYRDPPRGRATGFMLDHAYFDHVLRKDASPARWDGLRTGAPPVLLFWYRQSPQLLVTRSPLGRVFWNNPPQATAGMVSLRLDPRGRLVSFYAVPPQVETDAEAAPPPATAAAGDTAVPGPGEVPGPEFRPLFEAAGLDPAAFRTVPSQWTPPTYADHRAAFEGSWPERPELRVRFEAAAWRGRPVAFYPVSEWTRPERQVPYEPSASVETSRMLFAVLFVSLFVAAVFLARRNLRSGRADRVGSARLATAALVLGILGWAVRADHLPLGEGEELGLFLTGLGQSLTVALILWLLYVALEPYVRRRWPHALISWTRLLANGPRDPLVARDLLVGTAAGTLIALLIHIGVRLPAWRGRAPSEPLSGPWIDTLIATRHSFDLVLTTLLAATGLAMGSFLLLVLFRFVLKHELLAAGVVVALVGALNALRGDLPLAWGLPLSLLIMGNFVFVALRFGLLAYVVAAATVDLWGRSPLSTELTTFRGEPTVFVSLVLLATVVYAFRRVRRA